MLCNTNTNTLVSKLFKINKNYIGQRLDNYLISHLKSIPKAKIYHLIRNGKIKVNNKSIYFFYKLKNNDIVYIPPIFYITNICSFNNIYINNVIYNILQNIIYEDKYILIINKPNGMAVHGGNNVNLGLIEIIKNYLNKIKYIELVHRIDKDTSGILILSKKRNSLKELHKQFRDKYITKEYLALVHGECKLDKYLIKLPILKHKKKNYVQFKKGKTSISYINVIKIYKQYTLLKIKLVTGRTHQIRVHLSYLGFPIVLDNKYGNIKLDKQFLKYIYLTNKYLFLHAYSLKFCHPNFQKIQKCFAPLNKHFLNVLNILENKNINNIIFEKIYGST